jgi:hypothetical protein
MMATMAAWQTMTAMVDDDDNDEDEETARYDLVGPEVGGWLVVGGVHHFFF